VLGDVRAKIRERILRKHGYPPDKQEKATQTVLEQAALLSEAWAARARGEDRPLIRISYHPIFAGEG
jgi:hypothetical protein